MSAGVIAGHYHYPADGPVLGAAVQRVRADQKTVLLYNTQ